MESGRSEVIINKLIDMIENGQGVPLAAGKVMVNKDETTLMLRELKSIVEGELKVYREVNDRKGKIINDAKKEAEEIVYEAEKSASRIRVTKHVSSVGTGFRASDLNSDEKAALRTASDIYAASLIYTDEMLTEVNDVIAQAYDIINNQYGRMVEALEEKAKLVSDNKAELMASLKELSKEERYTQILDLSQLLSLELYREREKARELEKTEAIRWKCSLKPVRMKYRRIRRKISRKIHMKRCMRCNRKLRKKIRQIIRQKIWQDHLLISLKQWLTEKMSILSQKRI